METLVLKEDKTEVTALYSSLTPSCQSLPSNFSKLTRMSHCRSPETFLFTTENKQSFNSCAGKCKYNVDLCRLQLLSKLNPSLKDSII